MRGRHLRFTASVRIAALLAVVTATMVGCASDRPVRINERLTSLQQVSKKPPNAEYIVDPPDTIQVEFTNLDEPPRTVRLRQDGTVTLPLLEDVQVAGMTPKAIGEKLEEMYSEYYRDPRLLVSVANFASKHIYVYGEVGRNGQVGYTGYQTVADVIGQVGGVTQRAAVSRVTVVRGDPDDPQIFQINLEDLVLRGDVWQDVSLAENDVVYVPPTVLAWIGYQVNAALFPFRSVIGLVQTTEALDTGDDDDD